MIETFKKTRKHVIFGILTALLNALSSSHAAASCDIPQKVDVPNNLTELTNSDPSQLPKWSATQSFLNVYSPEKSLTQTQALIVPPTGGENFLDRHLGSELCKAGILAFTLNYNSAYPVVTLDLSVHDLATEEFLGQLEKTLRYSSRPTVLVGSSLGGLLSSIAYGMATQNGFTNGYSLSFQPHQTIELLRGAALTVTGGSLAGVLADSQVSGVVQQRQLRMSTLGYTHDEYESALSQAIRMDTLAMANPKVSQNILFFEGLSDVDVPTAYQKNLWKAWGGPRVESYLLGHPETIFLVYELRIGPIRDFILGRN